MEAFSQAHLFAPFWPIKGVFVAFWGRSRRRDPWFSAGWILEGSPNIKALAMVQGCEGDLEMRMEVRHPPMGWLLWHEDSGHAQPSHSPFVLQGSPFSALLLLPAAKATSVTWAVPGEG